MSESPEIFRVTLDDILDDDIVSYVQSDLSHHLYLSTDWSVRMYVRLAFIGCVSTAYRDVLLPEMQYDYSAIIDLKKIHRNSSLKKRIRKFLRGTMQITLKVNSSLDEVLGNLRNFHEESWLVDKYVVLCRKLMEMGEMELEENCRFQFLSFELCLDDIIVAGEIGYAIGRTYTSLTGFVDRSVKCEKLSFGILQLLLLGKMLEVCNFEMWNLGHTPRGNLMKYKTEIGARVFSRKQFLDSWLDFREIRGGESPASKLVTLGEVDLRILEESD